jgi:hypothetical protein
MVPNIVTRSVTATILGIALAVACGATSAGEKGKAPTNAAPAKAKVWKNAWAPKNTPLRGIMADAVGNDGSWQPFCTRNGLAYFAIDWDAWREDPLTFFDLNGLAAELGHPELANAPVIVSGLSTSGYRAIMFAEVHAERVLAVLSAQPVMHFAKSNKGFNQGHQSDNVRDGADVSRAFGVPMLVQTEDNDGLLGIAMAYKFLLYGRGQGAPWTYFCRSGGGSGHGASSMREVAVPWLEAVLAQRLPPEVDLRKGKPTLRPIVMDKAWFGHVQTLEVAESAKYPGERSKASWLPDKASAEAWNKHAVGMPYELPDQSPRQPSGLISNLVINAPQPSDDRKGDVWKIVANLKEGDTFCTTGSPWVYTTAVGKVPEVVRSCDWIRPDSDAVRFTGEKLLDFTVTDNAVVYVAHDEKIAKKPAWLAEWKDTGKFVLGGFLGNENRFRMFSKAFPKDAKVTLGPNGERPKDAKGRPEGWMYMTIVKRSPVANASK